LEQGLEEIGAEITSRAETCMVGILIRHTTGLMSDQVLSCSIILHRLA
jgi:hypothetical protein